MLDLSQCIVTRFELYIIFYKYMIRDTNYQSCISASRESQNVCKY